MIFLLEVFFISRGYHKVRDGTELERYLCEEEHEEDLTLILNHSVNYEISHKGFCIVDVSKSIIIESDSPDNVIVNCTHQNHTFPHPTAGFVFSDISIVLIRVTFHGCGATLENLNYEVLNSSILHFSNIHATTFLFIQCSVNFSDVAIKQYYGFAVVAVNLQDSSFSNVAVSDTLRAIVINRNVTIGSVGSGVLLFFSDSANISPIITMFNCSFFVNNEYVYDAAKFCIPSHFYTLRKAPFTIVNAAALTVIFSQQSFQPIINIKKTNFIQNIGTLAAAVLILMFNTTKGCVEISEDSLFATNINLYSCYGSALIFYIIQDRLSQEYSSRTFPLKITDTTIRDHTGFAEILSNSSETGYGTIYLGLVSPVIAMEFYFKNVSFIHNFGKGSGVCVLAVLSGSTATGIVNVTLESVKADKNSPSVIELLPSNIGIFSFSRIHHVTINGSSTHQSHFSNNYGSVIDAYRSIVYLSGHVLFENNHAQYGAAFYLLESIMHFKESVNVTFKNNKAKQSGGAIFGVNAVYGTNLECVLQISFPNDTTIQFIDNYALLGGNVIYTHPLYSCYILGSNSIIKSTHEYLKRFEIKTNHSKNDILDISSKAFRINVCDSHTLDVSYYPGETIHLNVSALDESRNHVYSAVGVSLAKYNTRGSIIPLNSHLLPHEEKQFVKESYKNACSTLNITVLYKDNFIYSISELVVLFSPITSGTVTQVAIKLRNCPLGFTLQNGECKCDSAILHFGKLFQFMAECNINDLTILRPPNVVSPWIGKVTFSENITFGIAGDCPLELCTPEGNFKYFILNDDSDDFLLANSSNRLQTLTLCSNNRSGVLCGACMESFSVVFGSRGCYKCSNKWLWTLLLYVVAGPLLIYLLYTLRLTLTTGTLNGIIFYAQAANVGVLEVLVLYTDRHHALTQFNSIFLSFLNLNLGFPLCFYNGMTDLWKGGLSLVFPIYLLIIVAVLIILSRYSTWLSNRISHSSVQVLVTVVHLSFSKLLLTIIDVFTSSIIYTSDKQYRVWYWDGMLEYMGESHRILVIISLVLTVPLILPYIVFLLFAKSLIRHSSLASNYLRPVFEAIHAPYKEGKHHWFVARLLLLIIMYVLYAVYRTVQSSNLYFSIAALLALFLIGQALFHPFKNKVISVLDSWLMFNLTLIYVTLWYDNLRKATMFYVATVFVVFMTFVNILLYHVLWVTGLLIKIRKGVVVSRKWISDHISVYQSNRWSRVRNNQPLQDADSFYGSCSQYREPILSDSH